MVGETRRKEILKYISESDKPVSGTKLAEFFHVSRQVIVQDIALLRAADCEILSTNRGYICQGTKKFVRVFQVCHTDEKIEEELNAVVDCGGTVIDVFVQHHIYGELRASLQISSRRQVKQFVEDIRTGKSRPLTNITSGHHCHTISADSEEVLELIEEAFQKMGIYEDERENMEITIRNAKLEEAYVLAQIEAECFPKAEAASAEEIKKRMSTFLECFFVAEVQGEIAGFINGAVTDQPSLPDELYHNAALHKPEGAYQTVFGLNVREAYRNQGIAGKLLDFLSDTAKERGKKGVILTCKEHLLKFYGSHGFENFGVADSTHGGACWYDMRKMF